MRNALWLALAFGLAFSLDVSPAVAQEEPLTLATGYAPDPVVITGQTRGERPINELAPGCRGYVGEEPDVVVQLSTDFGFLRLFVVAPTDVTLAVRASDGRWRCSGRPLDGAPREQGSFPPGPLEVWIGSTAADTQIAFELRLTEFRSVTPATGVVEDSAPIGGGAELGLEVRAETGRFRRRQLRRGFLPDPLVDSGEAGGTIDVRLLGGHCEGFVDAAPSHVLELRNDFDYFRVQLGDVPGDATLIIRSPGGRWYCHAPDDASPWIDRDAWPEGVYRIWVGARSPEARHDYQICYTEARQTEGRISCGSR